MSSARFLIGDSLTVLRTLPDAAVDCIVSSPPYWRKRSYLPSDAAEKGDEIGQEPTPGEFIANLLEVTDELWRVLADHGTMFINLGDSAAFSGGSGGDYLPGGMREAQAKYEGTARVATDSGRWNRCGDASRPRAKSVCWIPELFGASLAYGRNLLTGAPCRQWVTRPSVTWCKPNPSVGEIIDKFREATELIVFAVKSDKPRGYFFDIDALRTAPRDGRIASEPNGTGAFKGHPDEKRATSKPDRVANEMGAPPLNYMVVPPSQYKGSHYAVFPEALIEPFVEAGCPDKVCTSCGQPTRRINGAITLDSYRQSERPQTIKAVALADAHGLTDEHIAAIRAFGANDTGKAVVIHQGAGRNSDAVHTLATEAKTVLGGYFREFTTTGNRTTSTTGWTDCGHDSWRRGVVLDPFAGSGTTLAVATGHGHDAIGIDLDKRNADLARERVGMFLDVDERSASTAGEVIS